MSIAAQGISEPGIRSSWILTTEVMLSWTGAAERHARPAVRSIASRTPRGPHSGSGLQALGQAGYLRARSPDGHPRMDDHEDACLRHAIPLFVIITSSSCLKACEGLADPVVRDSVIEPGLGGHRRTSGAG